MTQPILHELRSAEVAAIRRHFAPRCRVLEIGGGGGWQASAIASWGCDVRSIDIDPHATHHPVERFDGVAIPSDSQAFDVVFSSNVLEHVRELPALLQETARVLRPNGVAIHVVPSATWRLWTMLAHYPYLVKRVAGIVFQIPASSPPPTSCANEPPRRAVLIAKRLLWSGVHGERGTALGELATFSRWGWRSVFRSAGFTVVEEYRTGIAYTGYALLPSLGVRVRRTLARVAGSSCHVFVVRPVRPSFG